MIPGYTTKVSEGVISLTSSIQPVSDTVHVTNTTSTTVLATIQPPYSGSPGILFLINRSGNAITTTTSSNIAKDVSIPVNQVCVFIYSVLTGKFYPGAIS